MTNKVLSLFLFTVPLFTYVFAQEDTLIYDEVTGNYIIQYLRENPQTGQRDSLVQVIFVPATKIDPSVKAMVIFHADSNIYVYHYEIENGANSQQNLIVFRIQFGQRVEVAEKSTQNWVGRRRRGFEEESFNRIWSWYGNQGLQPTWRKDGFALGSIEIPGIGKAYFQGTAPTPIYVHGLPPHELNRRIAALRIFPANHVGRRTIVPVAPLGPFVAIYFLDTLLSYTRQSAALGWLGRDRDDDCDDDERPDDGVVRNIQNRLQKARRELVRGDSVKARRELVKLVRKVDRLQRRGERVMTSEAYALLKYNTEYLIERLPERRRR